MTAARTLDLGQTSIGIGNCQFCDSGSEITRTQDGTPWHVMKNSSEVCEKPEGVEARRQFISAIAVARY